MSEEEKKFLDKLSANVSKLPKEKKEYVLGMTEGMALMKNNEEKRIALCTEKTG